MVLGCCGLGVIERADSAGTRPGLQDYEPVYCLSIHREAVAYLGLLHHVFRMCSHYHQLEKTFGTEELAVEYPLDDAAYERQRIERW